MQKTFSISVPAEKRKLHPKRDGKAEVTYTVTNTRPYPARARVQIVAKDGAKKDWFEIRGDAERDMVAKESQQFKAAVAIPFNTPAGTYDFRIDAVNIANPDEDFTEGEAVSINWTSPSVTPKPQWPKWLIPVTLTAVCVLAIVGVAIYFATRPKAQTITVPTVVSDDQNATTTPQVTHDNKITIPLEIVGMEYIAASDMLSDLKVNVKDVYSEDEPFNAVLTCSLEPGSTAARGTPVELSVNKISLAWHETALIKLNAPYSIAFNKDGRYLAVPEFYGDIVQLWQVDSNGKLSNVNHLSTGHVYSVDFSPDGKLLATCGQSNRVMIWEVASGRKLDELEFTGIEQGHFLMNTLFRPGGAELQLATAVGGGKTGLVRIWKQVHHQTVREFKGFEFSWSMAFSPDGKLIAFEEVSSARQGTVVYELDRDDSKPLRIPTRPSSGSSLAFTPDGKQLAICSIREVQIWDYQAGRAERVLTGGAGHAISFSPDGQLIAAGSEDGKVLLWKLSESSPSPTVELQFPNARVAAVSFSPNGKWLAAANQNSIKVWQVGTGETR